MITYCNESLITRHGRITKPFRLGICEPIILFRLLGALLLIFWANASLSTLSWRAESLARSSAENIILKNKAGDSVATVSRSQIRNLLAIKESLEKIVGIQAQLFISEGSSPNASAGIRGELYVIYFNLPMLAMLGDDKDALAAIMGHEVAHLVRGHQQERAENQQIVGLIGAIAGLVLESKYQRRYQVSGLGRDVANFGTTAITRAFSRDQEREADKLGLEWMHRAGFDPQGAVRVWQRMIATGRDRGFSFLATHPAPSERIENLRQQIALLPIRQGVLAAVPRFNSAGVPTSKKSDSVIAESSSGEDVKPVLAGFVEIGIAAYRNRDFAEAFRNWKLAADKGDARGQYGLASLYLRGEGVTKDTSRAAALLRLAADQDYSVAQTNLAILYLRGDGVPRDNMLALTLLERASARGNVESMALLAGVLFEGRLKEKDVGMAVELAQKSAAQNNTRGEHLLGVAYSRGDGVAQDYAEALKWLQRAATKGFAPSYVALGRLYEIGQGVQKDEESAVRYYKMAADRNFAGGKVALGIMYVTGRGVARDFAEALRLFEEAHRAGIARATYFIGAMYRDGHGVTKEFTKAYAWITVAAERGDPLAVKRKSELAGQLTEQQIAESQSFVEQIRSGGSI